MIRKMFFFGNCFMRAMCFYLGHKIIHIYPKPESRYEKQYGDDDYEDIFIKFKWYMDF